MRRTTSCGATVPFQRFSCRRNATSTWPPPSYSSSRAPEQEDRAAGVAALATHAEAEEPALAHRAELAELAARNEQRHLRIAEAERREPIELVAELERQLRPALHDRVDVRHRQQVVVGEDARCVLGERCGEPWHVLGRDREPGGGPVAAPASEERGAGAERPVEVERGDRAARPLPVAVGARDEHDGAVKPLDEPRRDDADHALVPALAGDDVRASRTQVLGPLVDLLERLAEDARLDRLPLAV